MTAVRAFLLPHRIVMIGLLILAIIWCAFSMRWDWIPEYADMALLGIWRTIWILVVTSVLGFMLAVPLGLAQAAGPWYLAAPARVFCTVIRGTPLLLQLWLIYYGLGFSSRNSPGSGAVNSGPISARPGPMPFWR